MATAGRNSKRCSRCNRKRLLKFFYRRSGLLRHLRHSMCKACLKESNQHYVSVNKFRVAMANRLRQRRMRLEKAGTDLVGFQIQYYRVQRRRCAICRRRLRLWVQQTHADHNHKTGEFRGILCASCNLGLGAFKDDPALLKRAENYVLDNGVRLAV
jgi:hypothetical protein